ncbi:hypothetical protein [Sphingomonas quercus]|uniref:Uncharacterized protein n=1 Tax=Sphingomonas quercus TaxID=2842451 RepID=A0ABS6BIP6_9SPHN|nr:hypothetical protein [Sphingomonas quercus]MBU3077712.1 hypothetical protein [Sphingomonas quercus]
MRWNDRTRVERPEYPKLVPITATAQEAQVLLTRLAADDPNAEIIDGGERGVYARVHNEAAEMAARRHGEARSFPLA